MGTEQFADPRGLDMTTSTHTATTTDETVFAAVAASPDATAADFAGVLRMGRSTVAKTLARLEQSGRVTRTPGGRDSGRKQPDRWSLPIAEVDGDPVEVQNGAKLGKGQLRSLVLGYLRDRPGEAHSPTAIGKALGRSSGAVGNALTRLTSDGTVSEASAKPRRYTVRP